jgi:predicted dinucleotide-binding enzyme
VVTVTAPGSSHPERELVNIAVLGRGKVGSALGARLASAGHRVVYGSRTPSADAGTVSRRDAVAAAEVVITALPGTAVLGTLEEIGDDVLGDKVVLDPSAAFTPQLTMAYPGDSVAQRVQSRFPRARVVKTLNTMNHTVMVDPLASVPSATVFVSGDDGAAKTTVTALLADLGWPSDSVLDLGGVDTALATEHVAPLFFATVRALQTPTFAITVSR